MSEHEHLEDISEAREAARLLASSQAWETRSSGPTAMGAAKRALEKWHKLHELEKGDE